MAVTRRLQALSLMPLHGLAEGRNQSIPSLLHEVTGLSKARISKGNLDAIRPSTQAKVDRHLEELLQEQFKGDPEGLQSFRSKMQHAQVNRLLWRVGCTRLSFSRGFPCQSPKA